MTSPFPRGHRAGAPFMFPLSWPPKWYPSIYLRSPTFELLTQQELEHVMGAHPILQQQLGLKREPTNRQHSAYPREPLHSFNGCSSNN